jgi:hypothetical protein
VAAGISQCLPDALCKVQRVYQPLGREAALQAMAELLGCTIPACVMLATPSQFELVNTGLFGSIDGNGLSLFSRLNTSSSGGTYCQASSRQVSGVLGC